MKNLSIFFSCLLSLFLFTGYSAAESPLIVHEWGTITTWHESDGTPEGRLNRIEPSEVLPSFVHKFEPPQTQNDPNRSLRKGTATPGRPDVTMRLETPVMYFYPGEDYGPSEPFNVEVSFRGGVVNEFYPDATASVALDTERISKKMQAGIIQSWNGDVLNNYVRGSIGWSVTGLPGQAKVPQTDEIVWVAPRQVDSSYVETISGESEKYLFYRGVAHLDAMFQTRIAGSELTLLSPKRLHWLPAATTVIAKTWIVAINDRREVAFRMVEPIILRKDSPSKEIQSFPTFAADQFTSGNLADLKRSMRDALIAEGLYPKEAEAMLATWKKSYYENPGRRIFYVVPSEWLDYHLPVRISIPHKLSRAFLGRIDLMESR